MPDRLEAEVAPLVERFRAAIDRARALEVPASMAAGARTLSSAALALYEEAAEEMLEAARDGR